MALIHETRAEIAEAEAASNVIESDSKDMPSIAAAAAAVTVAKVEETNAKTTPPIRIDIEELKKRRPSSKNFQKVSIYRVPDAYRRVQVKEGKEHMYSPMLVGLGPYHHSSGDLSGLRTHKIEAVYKALTCMKSSFKESPMLKALQSISKDLWDLLVALPKDQDEDSSSVNPQQNKEETQKDVQNSARNDEKEEEEESPMYNYLWDDDAENGEQEENVEEINEELLQHLLDWLREKVCSLRENIENAYADEIKFNPDMFILDSCFLLEVGYSMAKLADEDYFKNVKFHAILHPKRLKIRSVGFGITLDFIKLENQLPMELLRMMMDLQTPPEFQKEVFFKSMFAIIRRHMPSSSKNSQKIARKLLFPKKNPPRHLLEWHQRIWVETLGLNFKSPPESLIPSVNGDKCGCTRSLRIEIERIEERMRCKTKVEETKGEEDDEEELREKVKKAWWIPCATELRRAGIKIVAAKKLNFRGGLLNWWGCLEIPKVKLNEGSEAILRNIIAFEEQALETNVVSRFARVMDNLINKDEDVAKLREAEVVEHSLGSDSQVTRLFNSISEHITKKPHSRIDKKMMMVKNYYKNSGRVMLIEFFRVYFSRPWYFIAFLAATIALVCGILQTVYTMKD